MMEGTNPNGTQVTDLSINTIESQELESLRQDAFSRCGTLYLRPSDMPVYARIRCPGFCAWAERLLHPEEAKWSSRGLIQLLRRLPILISVYCVRRTRDQRWPYPALRNISGPSTTSKLDLYLYHSLWCRDTRTLVPKKSWVTRTQSIPSASSIGNFCNARSTALGTGVNQRGGRATSPQETESHWDTCGRIDG